jgi:hypothetical protein
MCRQRRIPAEQLPPDHKVGLLHNSGKRPAASPDIGPRTDR